MEQRPENPLNEVERRVAAMDWEGKPARAIITRRSYPTDIEVLWDAIVTPARLARWFMPVTGDLRKGGHYQLEGNASGKINECDPPTRLAVTWEMQGSIGWLNVRLEARGRDWTRLILEHVALEEADFLAFWDQFGPGALGVGWDLGLSGLTDHLTSDGHETVRNNEAWMRTAEGHEFVRASSDAWVAAAVAFGTNAQEAQHAGERTVAFYTEQTA